MVSLNVSLPDGVGDWIRSRVESGRYESAGKYIEELILRDREELDDKNVALARLDAAITRGLADADAGRVRDADEVFDELDARFAAMTARERM